MHPLVPFAALALLASSAAWGDGVPGPAHAPLPAQAMPLCDAAQEGAAACLAGRQCLCRREQDRPAPRWDCGILRPSCTDVPADLAPAGAGLALFPQARAPDRPLAEDRDPRRRGTPRRE